MDRTKILDALNNLPDASFMAAMVSAKASAEFMAMCIMDDPTPETTFVDAVYDALQGPMGWTPRVVTS